MEHLKYTEKYEKRIKRKQRELSRKVKGSKNYYKCKKELAILHSKLKNSRKFYLHKITKEITDKYDIIVCEKLHTKDMLETKMMSKRISDASFSEILRILEYKCRLKNKYFYQVGEYYPSSQRCNWCGLINKKYKDVSERNYECPRCGLGFDRHYNASMNIMLEGLRTARSEGIMI